MKILEMTFLMLTIICPTIFIVFGLANAKKFKKSQKFRARLIMLIMGTFIINGLIFGGLKIYNDRKDTTNVIDTENKIDDYKDKEKPIESSNEENTEPTESNTTIPESTHSNKSSTTPSNNQENKPVNNPTVNETSNGLKIEIIDGVTYVDGYMIANKTYPLPQDYIPTNTHKTTPADNGKGTTCQDCIKEEVYQAFTKMKTDASNQGLKLWNQSGYRSYLYQKALYDGYVKRSGQTAADTYSARPGHSEHQTGYSLDLNTVTDAFATTKEGIWVNENCYKYGFIIRYPKGKDNETGYKYEPWHLRYVGIDLASKLYNGGDWITMETYFGITSTYTN